MGYFPDLFGFLIMMASLRRFHNSGLAAQLVRLSIIDCLVNSNIHLQVYERLFADLIIQLEGFHYIIGVTTFKPF